MQVCTDRSLSQRRQEQNLRTPTTPTPTLPQGLKMSPTPVHLSAFKPGTLLKARTSSRAQKQCSGTFCFRKFYSPFSCPTLSSPTEIRREMEKKQLPSPPSQSSEAIFRKALVSSLAAPLMLAVLPGGCNSCCLQAQSPTAGKPTSGPHLRSGISKALPKCLPTVV